MTCKNTFLFDIVEIIGFLFDSRFCGGSEAEILFYSFLRIKKIESEKPDPEFFFPGHAQIKF
jgi:hypothetical protein